MGMFAVACDFALIGATQDELSFVQNIIEDNYVRFKDAGGFLPGEPHGSVIMLDSLADHADYDICLDLSENGVILIKSMYSQREGRVFYDFKDRKNILYQLVMMQIGFKDMDAPFDQIMDMFVKGCEFKYFDCQLEEYIASLRRILADAKHGTENDKTDLFVQLIDISDFLMILQTDELYDEFGFSNGLIQVINAKDDPTCFQAGVFTLK